jgi:hypothetical protein
MRVRGSYEPYVLEYEVLHDGTALIRFYENVTPFEEPGENDGPPAAGWEYDRYTLRRPHTEELHKKVATNTAQWLEYARQEEHNTLAAEARNKRDELLAKTDKTQIPDSPLSDGTRAEYQAYRQLLRDIPEQPGFPYEVTWPEKPPQTNGPGPVPY